MGNRGSIFRETPLAPVIHAKTTNDCTLRRAKKVKEEISGRGRVTIRSKKKKKKKKKR